MAQWMGQFSSNTHATKVAELEASLRTAVGSLSDGSSDSERSKKAKAVRALAKRLLSARLHMMKSRIVTATEKQAGINVEPLRARELSTREAGVDGILSEFGAHEQNPNNPLKNDAPTRHAF